MAILTQAGWRRALTACAFRLRSAAPLQQVVWLLVLLGVLCWLEVGRQLWYTLAQPDSHALQQANKRTVPTQQSAVAAVAQPVSVVPMAWAEHEDAEAITAQLLATADSVGLIFERAEFGVPVAQGAALVRHPLKLPVSGTYPAIRQFIVWSLQDQPGLVLEKMHMRRGDVQQSTVQADLVFALYTRAPAMDVKGRP